MYKVYLAIILSCLISLRLFYHLFINWPVITLCRNWSLEVKLRKEYSVRGYLHIYLDYIPIHDLDNLRYIYVTKLFNLTKPLFCEPLKRIKPSLQNCIVLYYKYDTSKIILFLMCHRYIIVLSPAVCLQY